MIKIDPVDALLHQDTKITVDKLKKTQHVTISASLKVDGFLYRSCGHYIANVDGCVNLMLDASLGGTYTGIQPMGWLSGLRRAPGVDKMLNLHKCVTTPLCISIDVWDGHLDSDKEFPLEKHITSAECTRGHMAQGVSRIRVHDGAVRGSLFLPKGDENSMYLYFMQTAIFSKS